MMKRLIPILLILFLLGPALADTVQGDGGVSLDAPAGWTKGDQVSQTSLVLYAPKALGTFHPNVNVLIQASGGVDDATFKAKTDADIKKMGGTTSNYRTLMLADNVTARALDIRFPFQGQKLASLSVWFTRGNKTYLITGTTTDADYSKRLPVFTKIAQTFRAKP